MAGEHYASAPSRCRIMAFEDMAFEDMAFDDMAFDDMAFEDDDEGCC